MRSAAAATTGQEQRPSHLTKAEMGLSWAKVQVYIAAAPHAAHASHTLARYMLGAWFGILLHACSLHCACARRPSTSVSKCRTNDSTKRCINLYITSTHQRLLCYTKNPC